MLRRVGRLVVWAALGAVSGLLAGLSSWVFLEALHRVTQWRTVDATWLVWLLPVGGFVVGGAYHRLGPAHDSGEVRAPHTGSVKTRCPSISTSSHSGSALAKGGSGRPCGWKPQWGDLCVT